MRRISMSLDAREVGGVPRMIQMYFQYDSTLSYTQKAVCLSIS